MTTQFFTFIKRRSKSRWESWLYSRFWKQEKRYNNNDNSNNTSKNNDNIGNNTGGSGLDRLDDLFGSVELGSSTTVSHEPIVPPLLLSSDDAGLKVGARLEYDSSRKEGVMMRQVSSYSEQQQVDQILGAVDSTQGEFWTTKNPHDSNTSDPDNPLHRNIYVTFVCIVGCILANKWCLNFRDHNAQRSPQPNYNNEISKYGDFKFNEKEYSRKVQLIISQAKPFDKYLLPPAGVIWTLIFIKQITERYKQSHQRNIDEKEKAKQIQPQQFAQRQTQRIRLPMAHHAHQSIDPTKRRMMKQQQDAAAQTQRMLSRDT